MQLIMYHQVFLVIEELMQSFVGRDHHCGQASDFPEDAYALVAVSAGLDGKWFGRMAPENRPRQRLPFVPRAQHVNRHRLGGGGVRQIGKLEIVLVSRLHETG